MTDYQERLSRRGSPAYAVIATRLRDERLSLGLTQADVARKCGATQVQVCTWETGTTVPGVAALSRWAGALGFEFGLVPVG